MSSETYYSAVTVGSASSAGAANYYQQSYISKYTQRDDPLRRVKPKGVDRLFNGTSVQSGGYRAKHSTSTVFNSTDTSWSTTTTQVGSYVRPGRTSTQPPPAYGPNDYSTKLRNKIRDSSLDIGVALAERKSTAAMLEDFVGRIARATKALRGFKRPQDVYFHLTGQKLPKDWKKSFRRDTVKAASDNWLAWQYGVRPLVNDIKGAVAEYFLVRGTSLLIRRYSFKLPARSQSDRADFAPFGPYDYCIIRQTGRCLCYAEFDDGLSSWEQTSSRLGLTNPALVLWELIPYSMVVDYFLQVGQFLQAVGPIKGLKRVGISISTKQDIYSERTVRGGTSARKDWSSSRSFQTLLPGATINLGKGLTDSLNRSLNVLALMRSPLNSYATRRF